MVKILLVCNAGISNTVLLNHVKEEADKKGNVCEVKSSTVANVTNNISGADVVLLAPQVAFERDAISKLTTAPVEVISTEAYANLDGLAVTEYALKLAKK